jgi:Flp pilus assembly protein TadD/predicted regulator of Ras-like GTPase activity (Roadblock/LC7/MglB family)
VSDDVTTLSDLLARDPASLVFLELGEALRRRGQREAARKVALKGLERHPHNPDAHDLLARVYVDDGDLERAFDEWDMVARLSPAHPGALKGLGFVRFQQGRLAEAEQYLSAAAAVDPSDEQNLGALTYVRQQRAEAGTTPPAPMVTPDVAPVVALDADAAPAPVPTAEPAVRASVIAAATTSGDAARHLFAEAIGDEAGLALLIGADGLLLAGESVTREGRDVGEEIGAAMSGVGDEAQRAMRHLGLGAWQSIVFETDRATVAMAPASDALLLVAAARTVPLGFVKRMLDRAAQAALAFLGGA